MREEVYDISGMHCAACSASVEKVTRRLPGVERSDVNLVAERMTIVYDETQVTPEQIIAKVERRASGPSSIRKSRKRLRSRPARTRRRRSCGEKSGN